LGVRPAGGNFRTLRKYAEQIWRIPTGHFDPDLARNEALGHEPIALEQILVEGSTYSRSHLKARRYKAGLKARMCEMCGQGEIWQERRMSLILDHRNGVADDNRLANLRIVCPNCAATLDTRTLGFAATGRRYGVSDNAVRKWLRAYEQERSRARSADGPAVGE
jgi:hypothetical protein